jgi:hypothetical protein
VDLITELPHFKGIVSRDWGGLLMVLVDRYIVLDVPATYLVLIVRSSSYVKSNICMLGQFLKPSAGLPNLVRLSL